MNCKTCQAALPDLLLDPSAPGNSAARAHLKDCAACNDELTALQSTFDLLDTWDAPEPSAYFNQKLAVRIREEQAAAPAGWFERLRSRVLFNTGRQFRPALAGAMALALIVGGGTTAFNVGKTHAPVQTSATVKDLQTLDKEDQLLQTMDQLLDDSSGEDDSVTPVT
ncbi:hypothetical protein BH10ACI4_BH10ACI4_02230 [soil metagenome]